MNRESFDRLFRSIVVEDYSKQCVLIDNIVC
jgi:hypothetical protein